MEKMRRTDIKVIKEYMNYFREENASPNPTIREATVDDWQEIINCQRNDAFEHHYELSEGRIKKLLGSSEKFYVALLDGKIVGFSSYIPEVDGVRARLHFLSVLKEHQQKGVGTFLMNTMLDQCRQLGFPIVESFVEVDSTKEMFLKKFGFSNQSEDGTRGFMPNHYGRGKHASVWHKFLS